MREPRSHVSGHDASEGALYILFTLLLVAHHAAPRFFALDNFDHALTPRLARALMRLFVTETLRASPPRRALLTTHNPLVLDGLDLADDRVRLFAVERNARGNTVAHRVRVTFLPPDLSLSQLWVMGRLGGATIL